MDTDRLKNDPAYQAYAVLRTIFSIAPILFGLDKFTNILTDWPHYLAPWITDIVPFDAATTMRMVGVIEIAAGVLVAVAPRIGAYVVALWLAGIIVNLVTLPGYYDVALRDFGLLVGALALAPLSQAEHVRAHEMHDAAPAPSDPPRRRQQASPSV